MGATVAWDLGTTKPNARRADQDKNLVGDVVPVIVNVLLLLVPPIVMIRPLLLLSAAVSPLPFSARKGDVLRFQLLAVSRLW
jgi:hypothetical protein